ncbi:hypothetical protein Hanom_Chr04g00341971 [Helianthus anomalus]
MPWVYTHKHGTWSLSLLQHTPDGGMKNKAVPRHGLSENRLQTCASVWCTTATKSIATKIKEARLFFTMKNEK